MQSFVERQHTDVLVVGGGLAGTTAAAYAKASNPTLSVTLVDKASVGRSGQSVFAAGVYALCDPKEDSFDDWADEITVRGEMLADQAWVAEYLSRNYERTMKLNAWGEALGKPIFERDTAGQLLRRRSRGHVKTSHCVYHSIPGMETMREQCAAVGVQILNRTMICALLEHNGQIGGAVGFNVREGTIHVFHARATILAASGSGFKGAFVGHRNLTGDMQVAAYRLGAELVSMEKTHGNTCARDYDIHGLNLFVGSGGKFINGQGEEFMPRYSHLGNRARLQDLMIALSREVEEGRGPVYMDMRSVSAADQALLRKILPETFRTWDAAGVNPFKTPIAWVTAWQGTRASGGGLKINTRCETNLHGLYAAGDITDLPVSGTSSVGGIPLSFAVVSGAGAGENAARAAGDLPPLPAGALREQESELIQQILAPLQRSQGCRSAELFSAVQAIMMRDVGYVKSGAKIRKALADLDGVKAMAPRLQADDYHELMLALESRNQIDLAEAMLASALLREESRGFHYRVEFPYSDNVNWLKWVVCTWDQDRPRLTLRDVPLLYRRPAVERHRPPGLREDEAATARLMELRVEPAGEVPLAPERPGPIQ